MTARRTAVDTEAPEPDRFSITFGSFIKVEDVKYGFRNRKTVQKHTEVHFGSVRDRTKDARRVSRGGTLYDKPYPDTFYGDTPAEVRGKVTDFLLSVPERDRRQRISALVAKNARNAGKETVFDVAESDVL